MSEPLNPPPLQATPPQPGETPGTWHGSTCRACNAPIIWMTHYRTGNAAPIEARPVPTGNIEALPAGQYRTVPADERTGRTDLRLNHFAACPEAPTFSRRARPPVVPHG